MSSSTAVQAVNLERFRNYLLLLGAQTQMSELLRAKMDAADVVQQTLLEACGNLERYRGHSDGELMSWLRLMLAHHIVNATRQLHRAKSDVKREQSLELVLERSSRQWRGLLAGDLSTPSTCASREEEELRLADALMQLTDSQRQALLRRYCQGWTLSDIARDTGCSPAAVAGLIRRGSARLRALLEHDATS